MNDIIDVGRAAQLLGVHEDTLRRLAREDKVPAFKIGGGWRFSRSALMRWAESQRPQRRTRRTVLVIDDEAFIRDVIGQAVEEAGYRVVTTSDGGEALEFMRQDLPDVVLLDLALPGMDGPTTLREIRKAHGAIPVVIITGFPDSDLMTRALEFSPVTLLAKPLELPTLVRTVHAVLNGTGETVRDGEVISNSVISY